MNARYHEAPLPIRGTSLVAAIRSVVNQYLIVVRSDDKIYINAFWSVVYTCKTQFFITSVCILDDMFR